MLPRHIDSFSHRIRHDDELAWPPVLVPSKRHDVGLDRYRWRGAWSQKQIQERGSGLDAIVALALRKKQSEFCHMR